MESKIFKFHLENVSNILLSDFTDSLISKYKKEDIICAMDDVQGDDLRPPNGITPVNLDPSFLIPNTV